MLKMIQGKCTSFFHILVIILIIACHNSALTQTKRTSSKDQVLQNNTINNPMMGTVITKEQMEELLSKQKAKPAVKKFIDFIGVKQAYVLKDGSTIAIPEAGNPILYTFEEVYSMHRRSMMEPLTQEFLLKIPEMIAKLPALLHIPADSLDNTLKSLSVIDTAIRKMGINKVDERKLIGPLTAYCGQVMIHVKEGGWELRQENDQEPQLLIKASDGSLYNVYHRVSKIFSKGRSSFSFRADIEDELGLNPVRFKQFNPPVVDVFKK